MSTGRQQGRFLAVLAVVAVILMVMITACGGDDTTEAGDGEGGGTFTYAASGLYPPFSMVEDGVLTGFDIELGQLLAEKMGMQAEPVTNPFETIIEGLNSEKYDAVIGSLAITAERQEVVAFSQPYYTSGAQTYVKDDNTTISGPDDLNGKSIGVVKASTFLTLARKLTDEDKAIGFDSDTIALQDLVAGRVDAVITDQVVGGLAIKNGLAIKAVGDPMETTDMAIAIRQEDTELLQKINDALEEAKADGSYKELSMKWLGQILLEGVN